MEPFRFDFDPIETKHFLRDSLTDIKRRCKTGKKRLATLKAMQRADEASGLLEDLEEAWRPLTSKHVEEMKRRLKSYNEELKQTEKKLAWIDSGYYRDRRWAVEFCNYLSEFSQKLNSLELREFCEELEELKKGWGIKEQTT